MRKIIFTIISLFALCTAQAQMFDPVKWTTSVEKISETEYRLLMTATIEKHWHVYGQDIPPGPVPTSFSFEKNAAYQLIGKVKEGKGIKAHDPAFDIDIKYFENKATFKQRIKVLQKKFTHLKGMVEFMACDNGHCTPPQEVELKFDLSKAKVLQSASKEESNTAIQTNNEEINIAQTDEASNSLADPETTQNNDNETIKESVSAADSQISDAEQSETDKAATTTEERKKRGIWRTFILAFLFGFTALLTPCVFPMIPMTVSYFTKQSKTRALGIRNAILYGLSIIIIYVLLGTVVTAIFGASALNEMASNVWFNLIFFLLLVVFAVSFLGAFEITLPSSWGTKADARADKGGIVGIFFMALALAIVSFSCTGPIIGYILVDAASHGGIEPIIGMFGFALALALPFALFAAFPGWLNSLPQSGGWLNTVKVVLGFVELALAFKFLSNADMAVQKHWLEREVFIAIWIACGVALTLYLFGKIKLPNDSPLEHISVGRLSLGLLSLTFTLYMIPGLWGAPLNLISAFPPPQHYSESPYGVGFTKTSPSNTKNISHNIPEGAHIMPPHDLIVFNDYDKGLAYAQKKNKPIMIDFTGQTCVNCRKMEQNVWTKPDILKNLKEDVVLISLFVDDKRNLPEDEIVDSKLQPGKKLKTIGKKWSELQAVRYKANTQPFYVLIGIDEENLSEPIGYEPDDRKYKEWLQNGIDKFNKLQE